MVEPTFTVGLAGVTVILERVGGGGPIARHVRVEVPFTLPIAALITEVPAVIQLTDCGSAVVPTVATAGVALVQVDCRVTSEEDPSL